jgi:hypothetical protein
MREQELIRLCDRFTDLAQQYDAICDANHHDDVQDALLAPIIAEQREIELRVMELGNPTTPAGIRAMARAAVADAPKATDGHTLTTNLYEYLALSVSESIVSGGEPV